MSSGFSGFLLRRAKSTRKLGKAFLAALGRLDTCCSPNVTLTRLRKHTFTSSDIIYLFHIANATFWLFLMEVPKFPLKLAIPILFIIALLIPCTSQFFLPATPIFSWLITYYSSRFIPTSWRPPISVSLLPTLESVLYGANISDILTRFTHPVLDIIAWLPYGVGHFIFPFFVAAFLWLFRQKEALHLWARVFGYLNLCGVFIQIFFPCSPPWYELIHGLTPANYTMKGSPGGLARIDALFGSHTYTKGFSNAPVVFGAFPSLHSACATIEALFISHFFPPKTGYVWTYVGILYWATMYLTHHYLIDVVGGACLATAFFYLFLPDDLKGDAATSPPTPTCRSKYELYDLESPRRRSSILDAEAFDLSEPSSDEEVAITFRSPLPSGPLKISIPEHVGNGVGDPHGGRKGHRHTASIASLIRGEDRNTNDGWSPVTSALSASPIR